MALCSLGVFAVYKASTQVVACYGRVSRRLTLALTASAAAVGVISVVFLAPGQAVTAAAFGWTLLVLAAIDAVALRLPDVFTLPLAPFGLLHAWLSGADVPTRLAGWIVGYVTFVGLDIGFHRFRGRSGLGRGDAKLFAATGAWVGVALLPHVVLLACAGGLVWVTTRIIRSGLSSIRDPIPFGAPLCAAAWLVFVVATMGS